MHAAAITVAFNSADLSLWASSSSTSSPSLSVPVASSTASSHPTGLPQGAKIGLGVGLALGAVALGSLIASWIWVRRRRNRSDIPKSTEGKPELHGESKTIPVATVEELGNDGDVHEMSGKSEPALMGEEGARHELEGGWGGYEVANEARPSGGNEIVAKE